MTAMYTKKNFAEEADTLYKAFCLIKKTSICNPDHAYLSSLRPEGHMAAVYKMLAIYQRAAMIEGEFFDFFIKLGMVDEEEPRELSCDDAMIVDIFISRASKALLMSKKNI